MSWGPGGRIGVVVAELGRDEGRSREDCAGGFIGGVLYSGKSSSSAAAADVACAVECDKSAETAPADDFLLRDFVIEIKRFSFFRRENFKKGVAL